MRVICELCGLPKAICICSELKNKRNIKKVFRALFGKYKDDFLYCELCGCYHYKNAHVKDFQQESGELV